MEQDNGTNISPNKFQVEVTLMVAYYISHLANHNLILDKGKLNKEYITSNPYRLT